MRLNRTFLLLAVLMFISSQSVSARMSEIIPDKLPEPAETHRIIEFMISIEPLTKQWIAQWPQDIPKEKAIQSFEDVYSALSSFVNSHPKNKELWLLKGLAAHYAYNLDMREYYDRALKDYQQAAAIDPQDIRPLWFAAFHQIQGSHSTGMKVLMDLAKDKSVDSMPAAFWEDYAYGAQMFWMPAHAQMAMKRYGKACAVAKVKPARFWGNVFGQLTTADWDNPLSLENTWAKQDEEKNTILTNRIFGMKVKLPRDWSIKTAVCENRKAILDLLPPEKNGKTASVMIHVVLMACVPKDGETLEGFIRSQTRRTLNKVELSCSYKPFIAFESRDPAVYSREDGGHFLMMAFSRPEPEDPGIIFEKPIETSGENSTEVQYYRQMPVFAREKGVIYYYLMLDSTESVFSQARADFDEILSNLVVE